MITNLKWSTKMFKILAATTMLILLLTSCSTVDVTIDYDTKYHFLAMKTYTMQADANKSTDSLTTERIDSAIQMVLKSKGYKHLAAGSDVAVSFYLSSQTITQNDSSAQFTTMVPYRRFGMAMSVPIDSTRTYDEGKLVVDVVDVKTDRLIWRGIGKDTLRSFSTPQKKTEYINGAIEEIMKKFPVKGTL